MNDILNIHTYQTLCYTLQYQYRSVSRMVCQAIQQKLWSWTVTYKSTLPDEINIEWCAFQYINVCTTSFNTSSSLNRIVFSRRSRSKICPHEELWHESGARHTFQNQSRGKTWRTRFNKNQRWGSHFFLKRSRRKGRRTEVPSTATQRIYDIAADLDEEQY